MARDPDREVDVTDHPDAKDKENRDDAMESSRPEGAGAHLTKEAELLVPDERAPVLPRLPEELRERLERLGTWRDRLLNAHSLEQRLKLLVAFGLTDYDIAKAIPNAKTRSVRRWRTERPPVTRLAERWGPVDDLCALICYLLSDGTYDEEGIVAWLRSRRPELDRRRPLDVLREGDFDAVMAAAEQALISVEAVESELVPLPRRPSPTRLSSHHRVV